MTATLAEVCAITMGQAPSGDSYNDQGEGLPLIAGAGDFDGLRISPKKFTTAPGKVSTAGDIILSIRASIGAKVWSDGEYCLGRGVAGLRPKAPLDADYLWHWLTHVERALAAKGRGATFRQVNRGDIGEMPIALPPLDEQRSIAAILDHADALRAKRRQVLAHLDDLTQSIFHDMFGDGSFEPVLAGELMPRMRNGLSPASAGANAATLLTLSAVTQGAFNATATKEGRFAVPPPEDKRVSAADFLMCRGNGNKDLVGVGTYSEVDRSDLVFPDTVIAGRVDASKVTMPFLEAAWRQRAVRSQIESVARTTNGTYKVNQKSLASVVVHTPPIALQREFAARVGLVGSQRGAVQRAMGADDELFASLQARAFRGEL